MSILLSSLVRESPLPGPAVATLNLIVSLSLVSLNLLMWIAISLHAMAGREPSPLRSHSARRSIA